MCTWKIALDTMIWVTRIKLLQFGRTKSTSHTAEYAYQWIRLRLKNRNDNTHVLYTSLKEMHFYTSYFEDAYHKNWSRCALSVIIKYQICILCSIFYLGQNFEIGVLYARRLSPFLHYVWLSDLEIYSQIIIFWRVRTKLHKEKFRAYHEQ